MKIKFYLRGEGKSTPVYIRVSISRQKLFRKKTKYVANSEKWLKDKPLQLKLRQLENKIEQSFNDTLIHNKQWIDNLLYTSSKVDTVQHQLQSIINNAPLRKNHKGGVGLSEGRIKILKTFQGLVNRYQKEIPLISCDSIFASNFQEWLLSQGYSINYVGKNIELLKTVCRDAEKEGKRINIEIKKIPKLSEKRKSLIIITPEEQIKIKELELPPYLDNARKWIILGCNVGQRGGDLLSLQEPKLIKGKLLFELVQQKTGKHIFIPVLPNVKWILEDFPYPISLQKLNDYIKLVCERAGINEKVYGFKRGKKGEPSKKGYFKKCELVGTHDLRRSFATNFYSQIPTPIIMGITGHSSELIFLKYIGKTSSDNALEFLSYFEKQL